MGNRPVWVPKGSTLKLSALHHGFIGTMAIGGGFNLPSILGRRGSHMSAGIGPKKIEKGSKLYLADPDAPKNTVI
jgi:allophanate hydrolase subunit 2